MFHHMSTEQNHVRSAIDWFNIEVKPHRKPHELVLHTALPGFEMSAHGLVSMAIPHTIRNGINVVLEYT